MADQATDESTSRSNSAGEGDGIRIGTSNAAGLVTLARPAQRNALNAAMRHALGAALTRFAADPVVYAVVMRAEGDGVFSAGLDLGEIAAMAGGDPDTIEAGVGAALRLCWQQECFIKPTLALMNGLVIGGGFGLGLHGTHRVAGERYAFACPETGLGLIPAGGIGHALARMPSGIGTYLALTGAAIGRADAFRLGIVSHCLPAYRFDELAAHIADADPVDLLVDPLHADPGPGELEEMKPAIARCFTAPTVEEVLARLSAENGEQAAWAHATAARLRQRSPLALKLTHRLISEATSLDLRSLLALEHRILCRLLAQPQTAVGLRSAWADRNGTPSWSPAKLAEVTPAMVAAYFSTPGGPDLALAQRGDTVVRVLPTALTGGPIR